MNSFEFAEFIVFFVLYENVERYFEIFVLRCNPQFHRSLTLTNSRRHYYSNGPALLHALIATALSIRSFAGAEHRLLSESFAYFVYDIVQGVRLDMMLHHFTAILLILLVDKRVHCHSLVPYFTLTELSTIFLCLFVIIRGPRKARRQLEGVQKAAAKVFRILFMVSFFAIRVVLLLYPLFLLGSGMNERFLFALVTIMYSMNVYWFHRIASHFKF